MRRDPEEIEKRYLSQMAELTGARVLEIGCGDGRLIWQYATSTSKVFGVDPNCSRIAEAARSRPKSIAGKVHLSVAEGEALSFVDKSFDGAIFAWSF